MKTYIQQHDHLYAFDLYIFLHKIIITLKTKLTHINKIEYINMSNKIYNNLVYNRYYITTLLQLF